MGTVDRPCWRMMSKAKPRLSLCYPGQHAPASSYAHRLFSPSCCTYSRNCQDPSSREIKLEARGPKISGDSSFASFGYSVPIGRLWITGNEIMRRKGEGRNPHEFGTPLRPFRSSKPDIKGPNAIARSQPHASNRAVSRENSRRFTVVPSFGDFNQNKMIE